MIIRKTKHNYVKEVWLSIMVIFALGALGTASWLLWSNFSDKSWEEIKLTIVGAIVTYGGLTWLFVKVILDIIIYTRRFKNKNRDIIQVLETTSKYLPKESKKVAQNALKKEFEGYSKEFKINDNFIRVSPKEIVIVFGKEYYNPQDLQNDLNIIVASLLQHIRDTNNKNEL